MGRRVGWMGKRFGLAFEGLAIAVLTAAPLLVFTSTAQAAADTCTWTGASSNSFANGANWTGCDNSNVPESGDTLVFPQSASNKNISVGASMPVRFINITGSGYSFSQSGPIDLVVNGPSAGITSTEDVTFDLPVWFGTASTNVTSWVSTGKTMTFLQPVRLGASGDVSFGSAIAGRAGNVLFQQAITGSAGQFVATDGTTVQLTGGGSTYTAATVGAESTGHFKCDSAVCFGDAANHIYMGGGQVTLNVSGSAFAQDIETSTTTPDPSTLHVASATLMLGTVAVHDSLNLLVDDTQSVTLASGIAIDSGAILQVTGAGTGISGASLVGTISGNGGVVVQNTSATLGGNNTYTGETIVSSVGTSLLLTDHVNALGATSGITTVESGGILALGPDSAEPVTIAGNGHTLGALSKQAGTNPTLSGTLTLNGAATIGEWELNETITLSGRVTGTGNLTIRGANNGGGVIMSGATANDYVGKTTVTDTHLTLNKSGGVVAVPGDIDITPTNVITQFVVRASEQIADGSKVTLTNGSGSNIAAFSITSVSPIVETVGTIEGNGYISLASSAILHVGGNNSSGTFAGRVSASAGGRINKLGSGTWHFNGVYYGPGSMNFSVASGTLLANPADTSLNTSPFTINGGSLGGQGPVGATTVAGGNVAPGNSPGCLNTTGALTFSTASTLTIELDGITQCTQYDKVTASGAVTLGSATLVLDPAFTPAIGTVFTIVEGSSVSGQFAGLANGTTITAGGLNFRVNYLASSVTLTALGGALASNPTGSSTPSAPSSPAFANTGANSWPMMAGASMITLVVIGMGLQPHSPKKFIGRWLKRFN